MLLILLSAGGGVQAFELGQPQILSDLGQPLSLKIPVRLDVGETLQSECTQVAVRAGEHDIAPASVTKTVEWQADKSAATIWVRTKELIDEPVVKLSLGCPRQQLTVLVDPESAGQAAVTFPLPQAASTSLVVSLPQKGHAVEPDGPGKSENSDKSDDKVLTLLPQITLPDAELAGLRWRFDSDVGRSGINKNHAAVRREKTAKSLPAVSLLMSIDVVPQVAEAAPAVLDADRIEKARLQFAALQRQQQSFGAEIDQLLAEGAQQESEQSKFMVVVVGIAVALLLLVMGLLLRARLSQRKRVVAAG